MTTCSSIFYRQVLLSRGALWRRQATRERYDGQQSVADHLRHVGLVSDPFHCETQLAKHVASVRVALRVIALHQELIVHKRRQKSSSTPTRLKYKNMLFTFEDNSNV